MDINTAFKIYRSPGGHSGQDIAAAIDYFSERAHTADTDAQADEWNVLARVLMRTWADRFEIDHC